MDNPAALCPLGPAQPKTTTQARRAVPPLFPVRRVLGPLLLSEDSLSSYPVCRWSSSQQAVSSCPPPLTATPPTCPILRTHIYFVDKECPTMLLHSNLLAPSRTHPPSLLSDCEALTSFVHLSCCKHVITQPPIFGLRAPLNGGGAYQLSSLSLPVDVSYCTRTRTFVLSMSSLPFYFQATGSSLELDTTSE